MSDLLKKQTLKRHINNLGYEVSKEAVDEIAVMVDRYTAHLVDMCIYALQTKGGRRITIKEVSGAVDNKKNTRGE